MFFLADTPQKIEKIHRARDMFSVFLYFFRPDLVRNQLFRPRMAVNAICFSSLVNKRLLEAWGWSVALAASFPIKYTIESMVYCSNLPNMVSASWL